jgi:glycosyltransferase involved in cell wall biosynthesis
MHPQAPWTDITFAGVYYNEAERLPALLELARQWFSHVVVGVQESTDGTLEIAQRLATQVVPSDHYGYAEPTFGLVLKRIVTPWTFVVSGDEMPDERLLDSFRDLLDQAPPDTDGVWFPFRSTIDGIEVTHEEDGHVRLFKAKTWPRTMHSGPPAQRVMVWRHGAIAHDRSLDEMVRDYLVYFDKGKGNAGWEAHNSMMMREAIKVVAAHKGWDYVTAFPWWTEAQEITGLEQLEDK